MAESKRYKAINFDLDTASLREEFGESGRRRAYASIQRYLTQRGFEHRQGSGYRSLRTFSDLEIVDLVVAMYEELLWLARCVQKLDVTNIGREYDLHALAQRRMAEKRQPAQIIEFDVSVE